MEEIDLRSTVEMFWFTTIRFRKSSNLEYVDQILAFYYKIIKKYWPNLESQFWLEDFLPWGRSPLLDRFDGIVRHFVSIQIYKYYKPGTKMK